MSRTFGFHKGLLGTTFFVFSMLFTPFCSLSQNEPQILHTPPQELPSMGKELEFEIKINNFKKFDIPVHLHLVKDGRAMFHTTSEGTLDIYDVPTFHFSTLAPKQTLTYSFYFEEDDKFFVSPRYTLNRPCLPESDSIKIPDTPTHIASQDVNEVANQVFQIELENSAYERSIELIKKIKSTVEEFKE